MDILTKIVSYTLDYINSVPAHSWYALGTLLGSSVVVTAILAWINRHRVKQGLDKLSKHLTNFVVIILSGITSLAGWIILNGPTFANFLGPWAATAIKIIGISTVIYNFAKPSLAWWKDRQAGKPITNPNLPNLTPAVAAVAAPLPTSTPGEPPVNIFQM